MGIDEVGDSAEADAGARAAGGQRTLQFSTDDFREHERIDAWREVFGRTLLKLDIVPHNRESFRARASILRAPRYGVLRASTSHADQGNSSRSLISNDNVSFVRVLSIRSRASQVGRSADLHPGDGVLFSHSDVGGLAFSGECRYVALALPRAALAPLVPDLGAHFARRVPAETPALRRLFRYLKLAQEDRDAGDPSLDHAFADHAGDLVALALGGTRDGAAMARSRGAVAARLRVMQDDVRRSAHRPDLSIHAVAARHGVSPRYVQRLFEEGGATFTEYLTEQRLAAVYRALRRRAAAELPISTVAYDCGFSDVSHFNRLFRRRFGCTPTDVRNAGRARPD